MLSSSSSTPSNPFKPPSTPSNPCGKRQCYLCTLAVVLVTTITLVIVSSIHNNGSSSQTPSIHLQRIHNKARASIASYMYRPVTVEQAERMAERIIQNNNDAIRPKFVGDVGRSKVHNIFWLHIQKCGTSLFNTLYLHFCPQILTQEPKLAGRTDLIEYTLVKDYPMKDWCIEPNDTMFYNYPRVGFHWPYKERHWGIQKGTGEKPREEEFHSFGMFRDPLERIQSAFSFRETTKADVPHYSQLGDPDISLEEYVAEPHIPNCQIKMLLGHRCHHFVEPEKLDVKKALERLASPKFYFGLTDRWDESICIFHNWYGGKTQPFELLNNRPTKRRDVPDYFELNDVDTAFVAGATKIFEARLAAAGCLTS